MGLPRAAHRLFVYAIAPLGIARRQRCDARADSPLYWSFIMNTQEQLAATQKANLDMLFGLTNRIVEGVEKLARLNMQAIRSALVETLDHAQKSVSAKEPRATGWRCRPTLPHPRGVVA
jgi:hypothetical protein